MTNRLKSMLIKTVLGFGLAFTAFALSSELRLGLLVPWIVLAVLLSRLDWERYGRFLRLEWVVFLAVVFRAVFFCVNYSGDMDVFQCGDGTQFWRWAQEAAVGGWPEVKSWTTVAAYVSINGGLKNINLQSRALYQMVVLFANNVNIMLWVVAAFFLVSAFLFFFLYRSFYLRLTSD